MASRARATVAASNILQRPSKVFPPKSFLHSIFNLPLSLCLRYIAMPCDDPTHRHKWPTSGQLKIERCEIYCSYCRPPRNSRPFPDAKALRLHVKKHVRPKAEFENVTLMPGQVG